MTLNDRPIRAAAPGTRTRFALAVIAGSVMLAFGSGVHALPTGGAVSAGGASIASGGGTTTITQSTQNVAINWQAFSIGAAEAVRFVQPGSSSVALNRVMGPDPSSILGSLSANGRVFLVNPNGILFGQGAQVNVGALVASTRGISDANFMAGRYIFSGDGTGGVVSRGSINADGGYVALLGASVSNEGVISARLGTIALAAGNAMTLDVAGDGLLNVSVDQGAVNGLVANGGLIRADGGQVLLTAQAAGSLLQTMVNNTGVIRAQSIDTRNGTIRLLGDMQSGTVSVGGTLDVSGRGAGQTGGSVVATAHHIGLFGANIDASGDAGGGTVLIGGGYQGNNPSVQNATATYMSTDSTISADAVTNGAGGTVVLWSGDSTRAYGSITARGGAQGGNGGLIETSGHWLDVDGITINASASNGRNGLWLLDPADVTITALTTFGAFAGGNPNVFSPADGAGTSTVGVAALRAALEAAGGTDVTITTTNLAVPGVPPSGRGDITVASALTWTPVNSSTLTLNAAGDVNINAAISPTRGNLVVCCGRDINVNAAITVATAAGVGGNAGGSILLSAGRDIRIERSIANPATAITVTNGNIQMCAGRDVILGNTFDPGLTPLMTLTDGTTNAGLSLASLGVPLGLTLSAGNAATGPGVAGGTVNFVNGGLGGTFVTTTNSGGASPGTPIRIVYNPTSYLTPTNYALDFTGTGGPVTSAMLVYPGGADKTFDGTTTATFTSLKPDALGNLPTGVTLAGLGTFASSAAGLNQVVTFSGLTLGGVNAANFALPAPCCGPSLGVGRTTASILPAVVVAPPAPIVVEGAELLPAIVPPTIASIIAPFLSPAQLSVVPFQPPVYALVDVPPEAPVPPPPAIVQPPPPVPEVYVPPYMPPRKDRN